MSDCRFGVSPVNYPDPDPDAMYTGGSLEVETSLKTWNPGSTRVPDSPRPVQCTLEGP